MTNVSSLEGLLSCVIIFIISCALVRRVKVLKSIISWKDFGILSIFHKGSVIGTRLKVQISISCILLAIYILLR